MKVNTNKTGLLCVSDSLSYKADVYIEDEDGNRIGTAATMKILGYTMSDMPGVHAQVEVARKRFRQRLWVLRHLRSLGFNSEELIRVYTTVVRPTTEYGAAVFHSQMTDEQEEELERLQNQALKCIYGIGKSARKLRELFGLDTLRARREEICLKFALKCAVSE